MPNNIQIIDDFLWISDFYKLKSLMLSAEFPWYYNHKIIDGPVLGLKNVTYQFGHNFYIYDRPASNFFPELEALFNKLPIKALMRVKANFNPQETEQIETGFHRDYENCNSTTAILYLNDNNGYTIFEDGTKVLSKENRLVIFPTSERHSGVNATDTFRVLINLNYF